MAKRATTILSIGSNPVEAVGPLARWPVQPANRQTGLTLIEVLLSLVILGIGEVVILQALARGAHAMAAAERQSAAYAFAAAKLADLELGVQQGGELKTSGAFGTGSSRFDWHLDTVPQSDDPRLALMTLTVDWRQGPHRYASSFSTIRRAPKELP